MDSDWHFMKMASKQKTCFFSWLRVWTVFKTKILVKNQFFKVVAKKMSNCALNCSWFCALWTTTKKNSLCNNLDISFFSFCFVWKWLFTLFTFSTPHIVSDYYGVACARFHKHSIGIGQLVFMATTIQFKWWEHKQ